MKVALNWSCPKTNCAEAHQVSIHQFPSKLYGMLESVDSLGFAHIVSWLPHGKSFQVNDPDLFMELVVPEFFKATKYRSFQRQLNLWGFKR